MELALWTTFLLIIAILASAKVKAIGIEIGPVSELPAASRSAVLGILVMVTAMMTAGSVGMQWAFRYYEDMRDEYTTMSIDCVAENQYDWRREKERWLSWHLSNSATKIVATFLITAGLCYLTWTLLPRTTIESGATQSENRAEINESRGNK